MRLYRDITPIKSNNIDNKKVTCAYLNPVQLDKWLYQNKAEYMGNYIEGCLLDNFVVSTKRGYAAIYESYLNPNSSQYYIEFEPGKAENVWKTWYEFEEENEQNFA